jgi:hypothetical protein
MASDSATQAPDDTNVIKTTTYHQYGFSSCQNSLSRPQAIEVFLDSV